MLLSQIGDEVLKNGHGVIAAGAGVALVEPETVWEPALAAGPDGDAPLVRP
jgi:hypothetical protein